MTGVWAWVRDAFSIVGGLAGAGAVIFSVWVAYVERRERKAANIERDEARRAQRESEQAQARKSEEAQARRVVVNGINRGFGTDNRTVIDVILGNYSDMPVSQVLTWLDDAMIFLHAVIPNQAPLMPGQVMAGRVLQGNTITLDPESSDFRYFDEAPKPGRLSITFIDAAGQHWRRYDDGRLDRGYLIIDGKLRPAPPGLS